MLGIPSAGLSVLAPDLVLALDLPLRGRRASRRVETEDETEDEIEIEDEKRRDGFPKT